MFIRSIPIEGTDPVSDQFSMLSIKLTAHFNLIYGLERVKSLCRTYAWNVSHTVGICFKQNELR